MIRYLSIAEVMELHRLVLEQSGGAEGVHDFAALDSAVTQPQMAFGGQDLYPELADKAGALAFSLICNHPFLDGNKRVGHAAMEAFLLLNGQELDAPVEEQEQIILRVAAGTMEREEFVAWVKAHTKPRSGG
jgi:death on curing protein